MIEDIEWGKEIALGILIGLIFIVINVTIGWTIGYPQLSFSSQTERYAVQGFIAPVVEEIAFRSFLIFALASLGVNIFLNALINALLFAITHWYVYGQSFQAASSLFLGAGLFALLAFAVTFYNSEQDEIQIPIAAIIGHVIINLFLTIKASGLIMVSGIL